MSTSEDPEAVGWELLQQIERDRDWRREHPDAFLGQIAADLWRNMDEAEAMDDYEARAQLVPWWASDVVECLDRALREMPDHAPSILMEGGLWLGASADDDPRRYLDFIERQVSRMRVILDALREPPN